MYKLEDGVEKCWCTRCEVYHPCEEHYTNRKSKTGYSHICKKKTKNYYKAPKENRNTLIKRQSQEVLKNLGYNLESTIPVYEQFLIKHDL